MTAKTKPWRHFVQLKDELRTGELTLAEFAADLHEVTLARGKRPIYEDPEKFFALTYPTHALRELVKDVSMRLAGRSDKAVRQLELTYGGGKTHTLIALYHLFRDPDALPDIPAVREFREYVGASLPRASVATLCFDKIDVERGIEGVRAPDGKTRALRHPWSVLAWQLAGAEGLRAMHGEGADAERETPPAEPLLTKLLQPLTGKGPATLILVDEVLMYAREKAGLDPVWRERVVDFFQYLTQAVAKVDSAAIIASLLATDPAKQQGALGGRLVSDLFAVFRRQREEGVQPVQRQDVAEVLRRRFFDPEGLRDRGAYRAHVIGVVRGLAKLDETTAKNRSEEEVRFLDSFPFHPELTDVFYSRWTQLDGFQRTRGILRTLATALRDAERWDTNPVIGPATLLAAPERTGISDAVRELASVADSADSGSSSDWGRLLEAELGKARQIQDEFPTLAICREAEQAVLGVFLHSQPAGGKANTPELLKMAGASGPDAIELDKGLRRWREISWFLDDEDAGDDGQALPRSWRLGNRPNLKQMHDEACSYRVTDGDVEECLEDGIRKARSALDGGAVVAGARLHMLPASPRDVGDDGEFRYVILGAQAASDTGKPSAWAKRFIEETTGPNRPRVNRNALVLAVPSKDGLQALRSSVRSLLGWEDVERQLRNQRVDPVRGERLRRRLQEARQRVPDMIRQAYSIVVTVNEGNDIHAFKLAASAGPLFPEIKNDDRSRIKETPVDAEALLPGGPYDLWRDDEDSHRVRDLASAFSRNPRLPKMLTTRIVLDTVLQGVERGLLVARFSRPDGTSRTWWREPVDEQVGADATLEVVLPEKGVLAGLREELLAPSELPGLWNDGRVSLRQTLDYFSGNHVVNVSREGYTESLAIPACPEEAVRAAVSRSVEEGVVWLTSGPTSCCRELVPQVALNDDAVLRPPPDSIAPQEMSPEALPDAWENGETNGAALTRALSHARGENLPWGIVRDSILAAVNARWLETIGNGDVVRDRFDAAGRWRLRRPDSRRGPTVKPTASAVQLDPTGMQELAEQIPRLLAESAGFDLKFQLGVSIDKEAPEDVRIAVDRLLAMVAPDLKCDTGERP